MHKGRLVGAIVLLAASLVCIISTTIEVVRGQYGLASVNFAGAVVFHAVTALLGTILLAKAHAREAASGEEEEPCAGDG